MLRHQQQYYSILGHSFFAVAHKYEILLICFQNSNPVLLEVSREDREKKILRSEKQFFMSFNMWHIQPEKHLIVHAYFGCGREKLQLKLLTKLVLGPLQVIETTVTSTSYSLIILSNIRFDFSSREDDFRWWQVTKSTNAYVAKSSS